MKDLSINNSLKGLTKSFLTNRLVELIINRFTNPRQKIESGIPQELLVFPILFLI